MIINSKMAKKSLMDYLLERIDPTKQFRGRQDVQQLLETLKLEEKFRTFEAVLSKALVKEPWIITIWDMEIFRIAKQLKLKGVAKAGIEDLVSYSDNHTIIDLSTDSIYSQLRNIGPEKICFLVTYDQYGIIEFFNEEMDFFSTERGDCSEYEDTYQGLIIGMPFERITTVFAEEGVNQATFFTSTRTRRNIGAKTIVCGLVFMNLRVILYGLRGPLLRRNQAKNDVLVDLDHSVSYVGEGEKLSYGDGEYKVKIDGKDPPSQILLSGLLETKDMTICLPKKIGPGVFSQTETEMKAISGETFLHNLRFKLVDSENSWPPNDSILKSKATLHNHVEEVINNYLTDLKISLINKPEVWSTPHLKKYIKYMQAENDTIISQTQEKGTMQQIVGHTKQILLCGRAPPIQHKPEKKKICHTY